MFAKLSPPNQMSPAARIPPGVRALAVLAAVVALLLGPQDGGECSPAAGSRAERSPARAEVIPFLVARDDLRRELVLANRDSLYLELDPRDSTLALALRGVVLHRYKLKTMDLAPRRLAWIPGRIPEGWATQLRFDGTVLPRARPRFAEFVVPLAESPAPGATAAELDAALPQVPPPLPLETSRPVPRSFRIRFEDGLTVAVRASPDESGGWTRFWSRWPERGEKFRVRLALAPADYAHLYRVLPPDVDFLVRVRAGR